MINNSITSFANNILRGEGVGGILKLPESVPVAPAQVRNFGNDGGNLIEEARLSTGRVVGRRAKQGTFGVGDSVVLPNLELDSVVAERVGFFVGGRKWVRFGKRVGLVGRVGGGGVVDPYFLDLLGDVGDGNGVGFGALEGDPDGDEEEDEDDGGADTDAEHHPETEAEDGGGVGELVVHCAAVGHCCSLIHSFFPSSAKMKAESEKKVE